MFSDPDEVQKPVHPKGKRRLERKIDCMALLYFAVYHAFLYVDKAILGYAAIFNIHEDLRLEGTEYR